MVSAISSISEVYDSVQLQQTRSKAADGIFKAVDTNHNGKITEAELSKAVDTKGRQTSSTTAELFKQLDQGDKGYITKQDLEAGLAKADPSPQTQGTSSNGKSQGAAPPLGVARGGGGGGGTSSSASSSSTGTVTTYDPEDLNQDGTVTMQEQLTYTAKLYAAQQEIQTKQETQPGKQNVIYG